MELISSSTDDPKFMRLVNGIISGLVSNDVPDEIFVIKIENWFDHKWLNFSGIGRVGFFHDWRSNGIDTALDEFWQDKITFPPFTPKRVIQEDCFRRGESGVYLRSQRSQIHGPTLAPSCENLHKRVEDFANSAIFVWLSSNTKVNRRGSVMVYEVSGSRVLTWYVGLSKENEEWRVLRTSGISREQVQALMKEIS